MNQRRTSAKRKLLAPSVLKFLQDRTDLGVPLQTLIRTEGLTMSRPVVANLLKCYAINSEVVDKSLFPEWLDFNNQQPQENPEHWYYVGRFPFGEWHYDANN